MANGTGTNSATEMPWPVLPILAFCVLVLFAIGLFLSTGDTRTAMLQGVLALAYMALGYFFGSSTGSTIKDKTISAIATSASPTVPPTGGTTTTTTSIQPAPEPLPAPPPAAPAKPAEFRPVDLPSIPPHP